MLIAINEKHQREFLEVSRRLGYMPETDVMKLYAYYIALETKAIGDIVGEAAAAEYMISPLTTGDASYDVDAQIDCGMISSRLRKSIPPMSFVAAMDFLSSEISHAENEGNTERLGILKRRLESLNDPRSYFRKEYLQMELKEAGEGEDYERAASIAREIRKMG